MDKFSFLNAVHPSYIAELYEKYLQYPDSLEPSWRAFFQGFDFGSESEGRAFFDSSEPIDPEKFDVGAICADVIKEFQVVKLIDGYRTRGHLFTKTNPVRERRKYAPTLEIENFGLSKSDLNTVFSAGEVIGIGSQTLQEIINHLEKIYCSSIGVEYMYIRKPEEIKWIQDKLNINDNQPNFSPEQKKYVLEKLFEAVSFESF